MCACRVWVSGCRVCVHACEVWVVAGEAAAAAWTHPPTHPPTLLPPQNKAPVPQLGLDLWRDGEVVSFEARVKARNVTVIKNGRSIVV